MEVTVNYCHHAHDFFAVERKGIGHPDTLVDMIAEEFNKNYINYGLENFSVALNAHVDKTVLVGASSQAWFGGYEIFKPITAHFFGKISSQLDGIQIPLYDIALKSAENILLSATHCQEITKFLKINIENGAGIQPDHSANFYRPTFDVDSHKELLANDTVIVVGSAGRNHVGNLAIELETFITNELANTYCISNIIGADVKVAIFGKLTSLSITVCVPLCADIVQSRKQYNDIIFDVKNKIHDFLVSRADFFQISKFELFINTKDTSTGSYIAPFGTALGKGDCGAVGRGNKINGYIDYIESTSIEAPCGKNPLNHVGKIYSIIAQRIADLVVDLGMSSTCTVTIFTQNGRPLLDPYKVLINIGRESEKGSEVDKIVMNAISYAEILWRFLLEKSVLERFRFGHVKTIFD